MWGIWWAAREETFGRAPGWGQETRPQRCHHPFSRHEPRCYMGGVKVVATQVRNSNTGYRTPGEREDLGLTGPSEPGIGRVCRPYLASTTWKIDSPSHSRRYATTHLASLN